MASSSPDLLDSKRRGATALMALGIAVITAGALALGMSVSATVMTVIGAGVLLIAAAVVQFVYAAGHRWRDPLLSISLGVLYGFVGTFLVLRPALGAVAMSVLLTFLFVVAGTMRLVGALLLRFARWGWELAAGAASIVLAVIVIAQWPVSAFWLVGTLLGVELIFAGLGLVGAGAGLRQLGEPQAPSRRRREEPARPPSEPRAPMG